MNKHDIKTFSNRLRSLIIEVKYDIILRNSGGIILKIVLKKIFGDYFEGQTSAGGKITIIKLSDIAAVIESD